MNPRTDEDIARILLTQADPHFAGWLMCPVCKKETRHYTKDTHEVLSRRCAGFGVRIAVWFRCSLSKQMVSGNRIYELPCDFKKRR